MATLSIPDRQFQTSDAATIREYLAEIGIEYDVWPIVELAPDADQEIILNAYAAQIEETKKNGGYTSVDLVNVSSSTPGLDAMLAKFNREHWHDEDEVRFTVAGNGLFHIHPPKGPVIGIQVGPGDMIRVPRGTHHWFDLCSTRHIKAIRFFQDKSGWTPHYTGSNVADNYQPVCLGPQFIPVSRSKPSKLVDGR
jgi:1,2-dihydroxy-3-keto-5-methylthiopentene dioxygenase